ncbi:CmcJ/NvfI family oxidoreductase [Dinoroseobacter sp. S124A]|uniref:CmcJ/NvfI family oxidoreductase n=1 Tax=Dinoroseobacter sp. S124A TaxID=3415128 RepID=UPI003C79F2CA
MPRMGYVNYHVHKPHRQAFHIDAGGVAGEMIWPEIARTAIALRDLRAGEATVGFAEDGLSFVTRPSAVTDFRDGTGWQATYDAELTDLLQETVGAREVIVFDHTLRVDDPSSARKPARNVHSDYSPEGAAQRLVDLLGPDRAADWRAGHYAFLNIWRPVGAPVNSAPLGFLRPASVPREDWLLLDLIYPDRKGQIMGIVGSAGHEWLYRSKMTSDEVAVFNIHDNRGRPSVPHSAVDLIEDASVTTLRQSLESRTLVRYAD